MRIMVVFQMQIIITHVQLSCLDTFAIIMAKKNCGCRTVEIFWQYFAKYAKRDLSKKSDKKIFNLIEYFKLKTYKTTFKQSSRTLLFFKMSLKTEL